MPPPLIRVLGAIFLALPGTIMWLGGILTTGCFVVLLATDGTNLQKDAAIMLAVALVSTVMGALMVKAWQLFIRGNRHQLPAGRLAWMMALTLTAQLLAVIALCLLFPGIFKLIENAPRHGVIILCASVTSMATSIYLHRLGYQLSLKWNMEHSVTMRQWRAAATAIDP